MRMWCQRIEEHRGSLPGADGQGLRSYSIRVSRPFGVVKGQLLDVDGRWMEDTFRAGVTAQGVPARGNLTDRPAGSSLGIRVLMERPYVGHGVFVLPMQWELTGTELPKALTGDLRVFRTGPDEVENRRQHVSPARVAARSCGGASAARSRHGTRDAFLLGLRDPGADARSIEPDGVNIGLPARRCGPTRVGNGNDRGNLVSEPMPMPVTRPGNAGSPESIVSSIGPKLRDLRLQRGLSLQKLAERADLSAATIHKIERSGMVPTITTLLKLAGALNRPVAYFVDEDIDNQNAPAVVVTARERPVVFTSHRGIDLAGISGPYRRFFLAGAVATVEPGASSGTNPIEHPGEELVFVLEGTLEFEVDRRGYRLGQGDSVHFRTDRPHRWRNPGRRSAQAVWMALRPL